MSLTPLSPISRRITLALAGGAIFTAATACGAATSPSASSSAPPSATAAPAKTVSCNINLTFSGGVSGVDKSTDQATRTGSGTGLQYTLDSRLQGTSYELKWTHTRVDASQPGISLDTVSPVGLTISTDGRVSTFNNVALTGASGVGEAISGTASC